MGGIGLESNAGAAGGNEGARPGSPRGRSSARVLAGRLVEVRVVRLVDIADVQRLNAEVHAAIRRAGPGPAFLYCDHRAGSPVARDVADAWSRGMRDANRSIAGSAILLDPANVTFNLQVERIVRCAGNASRLIFSAPAELQAMMETLLASQENDALRRSLYDRDLLA
jgi:hypothetical protein